MLTRRRLAIISALVPLAGCELGSKTVEQTGYRGTGMEQISDPDTVVKAAAIPAEPYALPADGGPRASEVYQNVPVLGGESAERFNHLMAAMTNWVSPQQGCNYCHNPADMASDELYQKRVARQMLLMTRAINSRWSSHVQETGVTCWTCHRGNNVPEATWTLPVTMGASRIRGNRRGQNAPDPSVGYSSLPSATFASYFAGDARNIRVAGSSAFPVPGWGPTTRDAEDSYAAMMHVSQSLGVNCTYCHNSQSFREWNISRAQRSTAYYGIRMVRDINQSHVTPLAPLFPASRLGPKGDPFKVNCLTCHQGQSRPLGGVSMLSANPLLRGSAAAVPAAPGAAPAPAIREEFRNPTTAPQATPTTTPSAP